MSTDDFLISGFGSAAEQVALVRRWIDTGQSIWAGPSISGDKVRIHTWTSSGNYGVNVSIDEAAVLADYAVQSGHPDASSIAVAWRAAVGTDT